MLGRRVSVTQLCFPSQSSRKPGSRLRLCAQDQRVGHSPKQGCGAHKTAPGPEDIVELVPVCAAVSWWMVYVNFVSHKYMRESHA